MVLRCIPVSTNPETTEPISHAFDREAVGYSARWDSRPAVRVFRARVLAAVVRAVQPPARVLDLGCGVGTDARLLTALGYDVRGIDVSAEMVARARERGVNADVGSVQELGEHGSFEVVLSNFGVLNCVPTDGAARAVRRVLAPGGAFVCVTISRHCPAEQLALVGRGRWPFRRGRTTAVRGVPVRLVYPSPQDWLRALGSGFHRERVEGLGVFVAPPDLGGRPGVGTAIEARLATCPGLRTLGDHTLIVFRRTTGLR